MIPVVKIRNRLEVECKLEIGLKLIPVVKFGMNDSGLKKIGVYE